MFQLDDLFLYSLRDLSQYDIFMAPVLIDAKPAIEGLIDLAAVLDLLILMLLAVELPGVVVEVLDFVQNVLVEKFFLGSRLEFLKGLHGVIVGIVPCGGLRSLRFQVIVSRSCSRSVASRGYLWLRCTS